MSRTSRIALMVWASGKLLLATVIIHEDLVSRIPFTEADDAWNKAFAKNDAAGMQKALADENRALCAGWFVSANCHTEE